MESSSFPSTQDVCDDRTIELTVNNQRVEQTIPANMTLAELLRDRLRLKGTKIACNQAACGACTVVVNGQAILACNTLAAQTHGATVLTIEGLSMNGLLDPLQQAFVDRDALQCGFCTPGMIMAIKGAINSGIPADRSVIARAISGNICRCGAYQQILDAAIDVIGHQ